MLTSPVSGSAATNFTSLILIVLFCFACAQCFFDLLGNIGSLRSRDRKRAHQAHEIFFGHIFGEVQAGQSGGGQQCRKAFFGLAGFQRNSIEQQFVVGNTKQETSIATAGQRRLQFIPRGLELRLGTFVFVAIHPRVLDEDVQAVNERPG